MHVAQLPDSHENGGRNPPRRAASSTVSPAWYAASCFRRSNRITSDSVGRPRLLAAGALVGDDEPLDEHLLRRDAERRQAGLDRVHVRAGTADVEVGVRARRRRARRTASASRKPRSASR